MVVRITLLALCLALTFPASAYAQDDCEGLDCENSDQAVVSEDKDPDASADEVAEEASDALDESDGAAESEASGAAQASDAQSESPSGSVDESADEDLSEADADLAELAQDEAEPASPAVDAAALQAFEERKANCLVGQPIQAPPGARSSDIGKGLYCPQGGAPIQGISENQVLFTVLGTSFGGDGRTTFGWPQLPDGYCMCLGGKFPRVDEKVTIMTELCRLDASVGQVMRCGDGSPGSH